MELIVIGAIIFIATAVIIELVVYATRHMRATQKMKIRKRLRKFVYVEGGKDGEQILKKRVLSDVPAINSLLLKTPGVEAFDRLLSQSNAGNSIGFYFLLSLVLAAGGYMTGAAVNRGSILTVSLAILFGILPYLYLRRLKKKRTEKFKRQLPDGLDLVARALKAGHAFTGGMSLAAEEFDDPLGPEFSETLDEINYGVSVSSALKNLAERVDCEEIKFFVVGVILQRETGGNLAELIETLASLIRKRFKFEGQVRTLTAEGRISAVILVALPFVLVTAIMLLNPDFMQPLITEPVGKLMIVIASIMMVLGIVVIKRMVDVKV
jgi:tight adherence protein B